MKMRQRFAWVALIPDIDIQFVKPGRNNNREVAAGYPWYAIIQPEVSLLACHFRYGKTEVDFSEFTSKLNRRQISKLKA
jgi:hypothetical protein